jgi:hypothetical protein
MRNLLIALLFVLAPRVALACPVCFGQSDSPMAAATNAGIWLMLGVVGVMLSAFASFFIYLIRRGKRLARLAESEGTASC